MLTSKQLTLTAEKETQETQETLETQELQAEEKSESEEEKGSKDYTCCGVDLKPFLPVTLAVSTVIGGICVFILQVPTLCKFTSMSPAVLFWGFSVVYGVALCCMHLSESVTSYGSKYFGHIPRQSHIRCLCMHHLVMGFSGPRRIF